MKALSELPTSDRESGSRNKYSCDLKTGAFDLGWVLPPGYSFPYDLRPHMVEEIQEFFVDDNRMRMRGREFKPLEICGPKRARKLIAKASKALSPRA